MSQDLLNEQKELLVRLFDEKSYVPMKLKELAVSSVMTWTRSPFMAPPVRSAGMKISSCSQGKDMGAVTGHKVVARITDFGGERRKPEGIITEIIGHVM